MAADALGESWAHVARHQAHAVRVAVVRHEIVREPFHRGRVLARRHVAIRQVGDDGDAPVAPAAGLVDADRLHVRAVLVQTCLLHVMADEPPQSRVVLADLFGDVRDRLAFRQFHDHRLKQEREPAARTHPRHRHGPPPCSGHATRGTEAWMNALHGKKFRCDAIHAPARHTPGTPPRISPRDSENGSRARIQS